MKTTLKKATVAITIILLMLCALGAVLRAQTLRTQPDAPLITDSILQPVAPGDIPGAGTFFRLSDYLEFGSLGPPLPSLSLINTSATVYGLNLGAFLVDDASITNDQDLANALTLLAQPQDQFSAKFLTSGGTMMAANSIDPSGGDTNTTSGTWTNNVQYTPLIIDSNSFWTEVPTNSLVTTRQFSIVLHNTIEDAPYDIFTSTNLALPLSQWTIEQSIIGLAGTNATPVDLSTNGQPNLFVLARFGGSSDASGLPDWWQLKHFGTNGVDPYAQDSSGDGWTYFDDYQNGVVPGSWQTPPAPTGLAVQYSASSGAATISWSPSPGPVLGYTVQKWTLQTFTLTNMDFPAGTTSFPDIVPTTPDGPFFGFAPQIFVRYSVQAHYQNGDSDWSPEVPLQRTFDPNDSLISVLSAQMVNGQQNQTYVAAQGLPVGTAGIRVTRVDTRNASFDTNLDIPISNVTNGVCSLPSWLASSPLDGDGYNYYEWYLQTLDGNNNPSAPISLGSGPSLPQSPGFTPLAQPNGASYSPGQFPFYFYDGRQQMKQNLDFLLRVATLTPFNYLAYPSNNLSSKHFSYPSNYVYAGLYQPYDASSFSDKGLFDALHPFEENYLFHNFVFTQSDLSSNGELTTGAIDEWGSSGYSPYNPNLSIPAPYLQYPVTYEFQMPTTPGSIPAILNPGSDAQFTYSFPLDAQSGLDLINITSASGKYYMTGNTVNYFGLPYVAALFATNNNGFALLNAGGNIPAVGGFVYPQAALPNLINVGYYFSEPSMFGNQQPQNLIPGNGAFSVTNTTPLLCAGFGQPIQIAGYAKEQLMNGYSGVYAYLGQYFEGAYIIGADGKQTTNSAGIISPYGTFLPTNAGPAALVTMTNWSDGMRGTAVVQVVSLNLDANHDGTMDLSYGGPDSTSQARPMLWWVNNDRDQPGSGGTPDRDINIIGRPNMADYNAGRMLCQRNLEDFARLWVCGLPKFPATSGYAITLGMNALSGNPAINLYAQYDTNGSPAYLSDTNAAAAQFTQFYLNGQLMIDYGSQLQTINASQSYTLPVFTDGTPQYTKFLFEGAGTGLCQLTLTISQTTSQGSNVLAQTSTWIDLHDVKDFYERVVITNSFNGPVSNWSSGIETIESPKATIDDDTNIIVFVHGINNTVPDWLISSDTIFKRLYWSGYRGKFATVHWPCKFLPWNTFHPFDFNLSEFYGYKSGAGLRDYLNQLRQVRFPNYQLNLYAHSQGGAVVSEAISHYGAPFDTVVLSQAAMPASGYDVQAPTVPDLLTNEIFEPTPEWQPMGYRGSFTNITGRIVNFFNTNDYALGVWVVDQKLSKPDGLPGARTYTSDGTNGYAILDVDLFRLVTDSEECRGMVARARTLAIGAQGPASGQTTQGIIGQAVDLKTQFGFFDTRPEHSAQFTRPIQTVLPYYKQLLRSCQIQPSP